MVPPLLDFSQFSLGWNLKTCVLFLIWCFLTVVFLFKDITWQWQFRSTGRELRGAGVFQFVLYHHDPGSMLGRLLGLNSLIRKVKEATSCDPDFVEEDLSSCWQNKLFLLHISQQYPTRFGLKIIRIMLCFGAFS